MVFDYVINKIREFSDGIKGYFNIKSHTGLEEEKHGQTINKPMPAAKTTNESNINELGMLTNLVSRRFVMAVNYSKNPNQYDKEQIQRLDEKIHNIDPDFPLAHIRVDKEYWLRKNYKRLMFNLAKNSGAILLLLTTASVAVAYLTGRQINRYREENKKLNVNLGDSKERAGVLAKELELLKENFNKAKDELNSTANFFSLKLDEAIDPLNKRLDLFDDILIINENKAARLEERLITTSNETYKIKDSLAAVTTEQYVKADELYNKVAELNDSINSFYKESQKNLKNESEVLRNALEDKLENEIEKLQKGLNELKEGKIGTKEFNDKTKDIEARLNSLKTESQKK